MPGIDSWLARRLEFALRHVTAYGHFVLPVGERPRRQIRQRSATSFTLENGSAGRVSPMCDLSVNGAEA